MEFIIKPYKKDEFFQTFTEFVKENQIGNMGMVEFEMNETGQMIVRIQNDVANRLTQEQLITLNGI